MSFLDDTRFRESNPHAAALLAIMATGYDVPQAQVFLQSFTEITEIEIPWKEPKKAFWRVILDLAARRGILRDLVEQARTDPVIEASRPGIEKILAANPAVVLAAGADENHCLAKLVGPFPFVDRVNLRTNLQELVGDGGMRVMIVDGPPISGRSYAWYLIAHVAKQMRTFNAHLIDLAPWGTQARPADVVMMISAQLGWAMPPKFDETAQDETVSRILLDWIKGQTKDHAPVCLVFDGLDCPSVTDATARFIGDIATAAGKDELNLFKIVLLAFGRTLGDPNVDAFALRGEPLAEIPLDDLEKWLQDVAADGGSELSALQATALATKLLGTPPPDPIPIAALGAKTREVAQAARSLLVGTHG